MTYLKFISMAFQRTLAYRVEYYTGLLNGFLYIFIFTSVWRALIPPGQTMNGLTREDMTAYAVLSTLIKVSFGRNESLISSRVRSGEIAVDLMKPYNFPFMYFCDTIGVSLFQLFARAVPILIFSFFLFGISLDVDAGVIARFIPVYIMAFALFFAMTFLISTLAFYFVDIFPFWIFYFALITLTSGAIIPLNFFPEVFQEFLRNTPFPYLYYYPTMIILGKSPGMPFLELFIRYGVLLTAVTGLGAFSYRMGLRKLTIAGG